MNRYVLRDRLSMAWFELTHPPVRTDWIPPWRRHRSGCGLVPYCPDCDYITVHKSQPVRSRLMALNSAYRALRGER